MSIKRTWAIARSASGCRLSDILCRAYRGARIRNYREKIECRKYFWVPKEAHWSYLVGRAKQPAIGKELDHAGENRAPFVGQDQSHSIQTRRKTRLVTSVAPATGKISIDSA